MFNRFRRDPKLEVADQAASEPKTTIDQSDRSVNSGIPKEEPVADDGDSTPVPPPPSNNENQIDSKGDDRGVESAPDDSLDECIDDPHQSETGEAEISDDETLEDDHDEIPTVAQSGVIQSLDPVPPVSHPRPRHYLQQLKKASRSLPPQRKRVAYTPAQRLLILDTWQRSGLPAGDFSELVMVSKHTLYKWKKLFEKMGPEGLVDQPKGVRKGSRLSEVTKRAILMMKQAHPEWGVQRIADMLMRGEGMSASPSAIGKVLKEAGYECVSFATKPNRPPKVQTFERATPNQLWQTDLFTFILKRQNRRLYLVAFMDDHSRFIVSFGLHASGTTALVIDVLESGIANYGPPTEVLTDNGPQFVTWRGKSRFTKQLEKRGIKQIVARPKRPQTLGKIERFWGTMWRELLQGTVFVDLTDARQRIGHFIDYYNFQRTHRGIKGLVPADRFFGASTEVLQTLRERVAANALELARNGKPTDPFYMTGNVSGQAFSVHAEGERLVLNREGEPREEIELARPSDKGQPVSPMPEPVCPQGMLDSLPGEPADDPPLPPGQSAIDDLVDDSPAEVEDE